MKITKAQSLRYQVEKWLAPTMSVRVTAFGRTHSGRVRYVCVETQHATGPRALYFFQHDDGYWHVVPPVADGTPHAPHAAQSNKRPSGDFAQPCVTMLARIAPVALVHSEGERTVEKSKCRVRKTESRASSLLATLDSRLKKR
jgi:hypothetical protein